MTNLKTSTLRPGLLVALSTSVSGNVNYSKRTIEGTHLNEDGKSIAKWETVRTIADPKEHEAAATARGRARTAITRVCSDSAFGLLCPESKTAELDAAIVEARQIAEEFNSKATLSRLNVYVIAGRIAPDDVEAVKAINSEITSLLDQMATGVKNLDVKVIREAASKAKGIGQMLSADAGARVQIAVETARRAARDIVRAGEEAATYVDGWALKTLREQRTAFLDLGDVTEVSAPEAKVSAIDLAPEVQDIPAPKVSSAALEF